MKVLHIDLKLVGQDHAEFRYFWDNPNQYKSRPLPLAQIAGLIDRAETDYYTRLPEEYAKTGQALYNWLDGSDRYLAQALNQHRREGIVLAIAASEGLAHLPWEILHDGTRFLVETTPAIVPIRWIAQANSQPLIQENKPANRALNVLFMATSPLGVEPVLDYEAEEGQILAATQRTPVNLQVEESGCLSEFGYLVLEYEKNYFDIFHLTGHATTYNDKPYFLTEDEYGNRVDSDTSAIINALKSPVPPLIFLSGCRTGYASNPVVASMAEELLNLGATAVLGWGETVRDRDATAVASRLYGELSQGGTILDALASTYQTLIQQKARDWHKLRLFVATILPGALVTPLRTKGRKQLPKPTISLAFRDDENRFRVVSRENFVGRRRQLQNCLRTLKTDREKVGVLLHGMGGWGKSSIASRLWDRLPDFEKILWWRQIDEAYLIRKLRDKLIEPSQIDLIPYLENSQVSLKSRLAYLFSQLAERPFLFILDDFERNLEPREGHHILKSEVVPILSALISAIRETGTEHRIIITCRCRFDSELLNFFYKQGLEPLRKSELNKKLSHLEHFNFQKIAEDIRERALIFADGNPRLLEFLNNKILGEQDVADKLTELEESPDKWKDNIISEEFYQLIDEPLQQILSYCLIYEISVPMEALEVVCESLPDYKQQLQRGLDLGVIEISSEPKEEEQTYYISRLLSHIIPNIKRTKDETLLSFLCGKAGDKLYQLWGKKENRNEEQWLAIFRLSLSDKKNQKRFREGFTKMIKSNNPRANVLFKLVLKQHQNDYKSLRETLFCQLEEFLKYKKWSDADEETGWIFFQFLTFENYPDFKRLYLKIDKDILEKIDQLWLKYSQGKFGFSVQTDIYHNLLHYKLPLQQYVTESIEIDHNKYSAQSIKQDYIWKEFCKKVGWGGQENEIHRSLNLDLSFIPKGYFPVLTYIRGYVQGDTITQSGKLLFDGWCTGYSKNSLISENPLHLLNVLMYRFNNTIQKLWIM